MGIDNINKQRRYWHDKAHDQFIDLLFASMEGNKEKHKELMDDLGASLAVIWRFDKRLAQEGTRAKRARD